MTQLDRRELIQMSVLALLGIQMGCSPENKTSTKGATTLVPKKLSAIENLTARGLGAGRKALAAAERTGKTWLDAQTTPPSARNLFDTFMSELPESPHAHGDWIRKRHKADIRDNRLEVVAGWQMSRTETHLYALLALTAPKP